MEHDMGYFVGIAGAWIFSDGIYSILLYYGKPSYRGAPPQDWVHDHWIRVIRMALGLFLVAAGWRPG